ncbi:MAG: primosomal protein N' [Bacteroidales bacterium]|nr:primosomal protein N' [Bacteroidales bacterium]
MEPETYAEVILPLPVSGTFTYHIPDSLREKAIPGVRIIVPFGEKKSYTGVIRRIVPEPPGTFLPKEINRVLDDKPLIQEFHFQFWEWMSDYYLCTLGEVMDAALPGGLKPAHHFSYSVHSGFKEPGALTDKERNMFFYIHQHPGITDDELGKEFGKRNAPKLIRSLLEKNALTEKSLMVDPYKPRTLRYIRISPGLTEQALQQMPETLKQAKRQWEMFTACAADWSPGETPPSFLKSGLLKKHPYPGALTSLKEKGILEEYELPVSRLERGEEKAAHLKHLTPAQQQVLENILELFREKNTVLLHGVTSSGKTEIYFHLIREQLTLGKQVLYLLPEIAITGQMIHRLKEAFGDLAGIYHSRYSDAERIETWLNLSGNDASKPLKIVLGVRAAVFLPFREPGLIIVDEEHETSYKQDSTSPRYHARDAAVMLGHLTGAKVLLGSATPSLESYYNARTGKYGLTELKERYTRIAMPEIRVVDMKKMYKRREVRGHLSHELHEAVEEALQEGEQVILFQNRRGFSPYIQCADCGWIPYCKHCDVALTYHKNSNRLVCHYCGYNIPVPTRCPSCASTHLHTRGFGTEKIEEEIRLLFPEAHPTRLDLDTARSRKQYLSIIQDFEEQKTNILIGTQMITKGLDFGHVRVVGILNADNLLHFPDFRAWERSFQLMAQVSGRAGRKDKRGRVFIQTYDPGHPVITDVLKHDYFHMYNTQLQERRLFHYPPFYRLIRITLKHRNNDAVNRAATELTSLLRKNFRNNVLGPQYAFIPRVRNRYIKQILLKLERHTDKSTAKTILQQFEQYLRETPAYRGIQFINDVDPL